LAGGFGKVRTVDQSRGEKGCIGSHKEKPCAPTFVAVPSAKVK
jgi:hypothetical protein